MKRIGILAGALGAFAMASMGNAWPILALDREHPVSAKRRRVSAAPRVNGRSKYMPHQGAKERERAKRCWMQPFHGPLSDYSPNLRSASVMHQMSEREFESREGQRNIGRP